jgi:thermostable 8-oxoguanine DNA glycosylase
MIVHIKVGVLKENGKWVGRWQSQSCVREGNFTCTDCTDYPNEVLANRREELERKLDKALRLAFPKASYIVQHRESNLKEDA